MSESIAQIWANKFIASRRPMPVPTMAVDIDVEEAAAVADAERRLLDLANSAAAKKLRDEAGREGHARTPRRDEIRDMAAAIAAEVLEATQSQARVDRTVVSLLQS